MDTQKNTADSSIYTGRFAARPSPEKRSASAAPRKQTSEAARRPSGFAAPSGKKQVKNSSARPAEKAAPPMQKTSEKKQPAAQAAKPKAKKRSLKPLLMLLGIAAIIYLLIALLFGGESKTYHQLPIVERESIASFEPEVSSPIATEAS